MAEKVNPVKLKQDAERLEKAGRLDQAIALYRQIVEQNPRDWNTINKIGDLYAKLNRTREAAEEYSKVADFYAKDGFLVRAIAMWKKVNKLDTAILEPYLRLAELYAKQGLMMEAKSQYQIVVDEYLKRGKTKDAAEVLKKMAELDPGDLKVRSKLADIYTREGSAPKAVEEHIAIAVELSKKGHLAEALQVLEKGLRIDPRSGRLREELARVHMIQKNYDRAAHYLEEAAQSAPNDIGLLTRLGDAYIEARKIEEAEALFKRLLELNPSDEDARVQMGRVYLLQQQFDRAFDEFQPTVDRLLQRKDGEKAAALLQQIAQRNPAHIKTLVKLAEVYRLLQMEGAVSQTYSQLTEAYIHEGAFEQAAQVLETLVSREPQNQQHRSKLEFVRSRSGTGKRAAPAPALEAIEEVEFDLEASEAGSVPLAFEEPESPRAPAAVAPPVAFSPPAPPPAAARMAIEISGPLAAEDREFIDEHLAEGRVFRKYGLVDKAVDQFEAIVARFPDHAEARQDLRDVYKEKGLPSKAAEHCLALAEIFRLKGDTGAAAAHEAEAQALMPAVSPAPALSAAAPEVHALPREEEITLEGQEDFSLAVEEEEISLDMGAQAEGGDSVVAEAPRGEEQAPSDLVLEEDLLTDQEITPQFVEEASQEAELVIESEFETPLEEPTEGLPVLEAPPEAQEEAPSVPGLDLGLEEELSLEGAFEAEVEEPVPPPAPEPALPRTPVAAMPAPAVAAGSATDLARTLEEVDQYISLGFVDDARDALRELRTRYGDHPSIQAKAAELGLAEEGERVSYEGERMPYETPAQEEELLDQEPSFEVETSYPSEPAEEPAVSIDLGLDLSEPEPESAPSFSSGPSEPTMESLVAGIEENEAVSEVESSVELSELFQTQSAVAEPEAPVLGTEFGDSGLAEIFKEFKKGVDKQLGKEDYDTRYNLGIAYKEMGLLDEAIAEFQLAAKDDARLLECSSMLGICFMEKGMPKLAVKWFERGLKAVGRTEEEYQGLRYDLAAAYEAAGEVREALTLYTDLYGQNANFRDVAAKVRHLRGGA